MILWIDSFNIDAMDKLYPFSVAILTPCYAKLQVVLYCNRRKAATYVVLGFFIPIYV
jgi:hypothetical protein